MMIACIGNSHLAAFKLGWAQICGLHKGVHIDFFGAAASAMRYLEVDGDRLVPTTEDTRQQMINTGGKDEIRNDYDAYILVGMGLGIVHLVNAYRFHRPANLFDGETQVVSDDFVAKLRIHLIDRSAAVLNLRRLRKISNAPMFVALNPYPTSDVLRLPGFEVWNNLPVIADCQHYLGNILQRECRHATVIEQPEITLASKYLTKPEYTRNAELLKGAGTRAANAGDPWHMNAAYGAIMLGSILADIKSKHAA
jgi:hypothetical protein